MNLIVFDIDDTLTRSEYQHQRAYVDAMKTFGITNINQNWKSYTHHTDSYILKENYEHNLKIPFEFEFIEGFEKEMTKNILELDETVEIEGAGKIINYLNTREDYAMAFATGSLLQPALIKLQHANIWHTENLLLGSNRLFEREQIVTHAIEKAKLYYNKKSFENIIAVGDGIWDLKTARNLNLHFIGIGSKNYADFEKENIKIYIENWNDFDLEKAEKVLELK